MERSQQATGRFITLEGGEGTGKSTQAKELAKRLREAGHDVVLTREPGGTAFGEKLRDVLLADDAPERSQLAETLAFYAARADHLEQVIRPALARGAWVITDRFSDSTMAYQGIASATSADVIRTLDDLVIGTTKPNLTVILDLDPELGLRRARERAAAAENAGLDHFEAKDLSFHVALRAAFLDIARQEPERCVVVDAGIAESDVANAIWRAVEARLGQ